MAKYLKRLFCKHEWRPRDGFIYYDPYLKRVAHSRFICPKCGKSKATEKLLDR